MTKVLVSRPAAATIFEEVQRWVERGLAEGGSPLESLMYPLSALVPRGRNAITPLELVAARDIAEIVIDAAAIPPDDVKAFSPANCHFVGDIDLANQAFNHHIDALLSRAPRLGVHSKLHTHPFEGGAFLSGGDMHHGVVAGKAVTWRRRQGLDSAILHVVWPDGPPARARSRWQLTSEGGLAQGADGRRVLWRIRSWASLVDPQRGTLDMVDLGDAEVVSPRHDSVKAARRKPYWQTKTGARWCDGQKADLRAAGLAVSRNLLGRGWRRYLLSTGPEQLLLAMPPDFPLLPPRVLRVRRAWCNDFEALDLPPSWQAPSFACRLLDLVRHYHPISGATAGHARPGAPFEARA